MKTMRTSFRQMRAAVPADIQEDVNMEFAVSNRLYSLMNERGVSKEELAKALGKCPNEVSEWLSGQYNFNLSTLAQLSSYFGESMIKV